MAERPTTLKFKCDAPGCKSFAETISPDDPADVPHVLKLRGWECGKTGEGETLHYCPAHASMATLIADPANN